LSQPWERIGPDTDGGRYLRQFWQPICRSVDLAVGDVFGVGLLGEQWTLYRDHKGRAHLVSARCPHRGTPLRFGVVSEGGLQCLHHGLVYDEQGYCSELSAGIVVIPVVEKYELVFGFFGEGEPPRLHFDLLEGENECWAAPPEVWPCPFFLRLENTLDVAHVASAHRYSGVSEAMDSLGYRIEDGKDSIRLHLEVGAQVLYTAPNRLQFPVPVSDDLGWRELLCFRVPIDSDRCVSFTVVPVPANLKPSPGYRSHPHASSTVADLGERVIRGERRLADLVGTENLTEVEDYVMLVSTHQESNGQERLAPFDGAIRLLRMRWAEAAKGMSES
jgi:5,5'-dehydrodivanillate O-demethylase oxygenase subunit